MNRVVFGKVCFLFCAFLHFSASAVTNGLVAYYPFNGNGNDESGNGLNGSVYGATPIADHLGNDTGAYYFDGINDRIDLPMETLGFERTNAFSQSLWIKTTDTDTANNILAKNEFLGRDRGLNLVLARGFFRFQLISDNPIGDRLIVRTESLVNDGQWHHVVATYDGSSAASGVKIYLDGVLANMVVGADALVGPILNTITPTIGARNSAFHYRGAIDEVRIYDRVLSDEEVAYLYSGGSAEMDVYSEALTNLVVVAGESETRAITV